MERDRTMLAEALDAHSTSVLLVDRSARIVHANRRAQLLLESADGLRDTGKGLETMSPALTATLRGLCAECAETTNGRGFSPGGALSLPRRSGRRNLQVVVSPLKRRTSVTVHDDDEVTAVVFVSDPETTPVPTPSVLQRLYGLSPAEAIVASHLAAGQTLEEIAAELHYTREHLALGTASSSSAGSIAAPV